MRRGSSLRYPLKEKKRIVHNLTVHGAPARSSRLNGVEHKKPVSESLSTMTIQSEKSDGVDNRSEHSPITNGTSSLLRPQALARVRSEDVSSHVTRSSTGSLEDVQRSSSITQHPSLSGRSLSLPVKDEKTVTLRTEPVKPKPDIDDEFSQLRDTPALQFLTRKDLYKYMTSAGVRFLVIVIIYLNYLIVQSAAQEFFADRAMMELVQRIRKDPTLFLK